MLVLIFPQTYTPLFLFLIWDFILFLVLLGLFSNKLGFGRSQDMKYTLLASALVEAEAGQDTGSCIPCHLS